MSELSYASFHLMGKFLINTIPPNFENCCHACWRKLKNQNVFTTKRALRSRLIRNLPILDELPNIKYEIK